MKRRIDGYLKGIPTVSDTLRQLFGTIRTSDGQLAANVTTTWGREQTGSLAQGLSLVPDVSFTVDTDASGGLQLQVMAGIYVVSFAFGGVTHVFRVAVPDEEGPFDISSLVNGPWTESGNLSVFEHLANTSKAWAVTPEDILVDEDEYSSKHHMLKSQQAQALSEGARDGSIEAQGLSEAARDASVIAQGLSEAARDVSVAARDTALQAEAAATASAQSADADAQATAADRVQTGQDALATSADGLATAAHRVQTGQDRLASETAASQAALYDGPWLDDVVALLADTALTYTGGTPSSVAANDIVRTRAEGFSYEVAASAATDQHVTTAGGVKLYVLAGEDGSMSARAFGWSADDTQATATANTAAAQAAINASHAVGSGKVLFPSGNGYINGTLHMKRSTLLCGGNWLPSSSPATIKLADNSNCDMIRTEFAGGSYNFATDTMFGGGVKRLLIDGNKAGQSGANDPVTGQLPVGINAKHWILGAIEDVRVTQCVGHGVWWGGDSNTCRVTRLQSARNGKSGVYINNSTANTVFELLNCENNADYGVETGVLAADTNGATFLNPAFEYNRKSDFYFGNGNRAGVVVISPRSLGIAYNGGAMTSGSATLTIASGQTYQFQASDVGALVHVPGAGASGADLIAYISAFTSATEVMLSVASSTTVSAQRVTQGATYTFPASAPPPRLIVQSGNHVTDRPVAVDNKSASTRRLHTAALMHFYLEEGIISSGTEEWTQFVTVGDISYALGASYSRPFYKKDAVGMVQVRGHINLISGTLICTLPTGFRPEFNMRFAVSDTTGAGVTIEVRSDGGIHHVAGPKSGVDINVNFGAA